MLEKDSSFARAVDNVDKYQNYTFHTIAPENCHESAGTYSKRVKATCVRDLSAVPSVMFGNLRLGF